LLYIYTQRRVIFDPLPAGARMFSSDRLFSGERMFMGKRMFSSENACISERLRTSEFIFTGEGYISTALNRVSHQYIKIL